MTPTYTNLRQPDKKTPTLVLFYFLMHKPARKTPTMILFNFFDSTNTNETTLYFLMSAMSKVIQRHEIRLADYSTFLADCGGYLGLFLGASLLSITDAIIAYICGCLRSPPNFLF